MVNLVYVRNQMAHIWVLNDIQYRQKPLQNKEQLQLFKSDYKMVMSELIDSYHSLLGKKGFQQYLEEIIMGIEERS